MLTCVSVIPTHFVRFQGVLRSLPTGVTLLKCNNIQKHLREFNKTTEVMFDYFCLKIL